LILPLNREYKPLGLRLYSVGVNYDDYVSQAIPANQLNFEWCYKGGAKVEHCSHNMFNDSCPPWHSAKMAREYLMRVKGLLGLIDLKTPIGCN
jgi:hypothetical protein